MYKNIREIENNKCKNQNQQYIETLHKKIIELEKKLTNEQLIPYKEIKDYLEERLTYENEYKNYKHKNKNKIENYIIKEPKIPKPPMHVILGSGGVGKSYFIKAIILYVTYWSRSNNRMEGNSELVKIAATTGITASHINGDTVHKLFDICQTGQ